MVAKWRTLQVDMFATQAPRPRNGCFGAVPCPHPRNSLHNPNCAGCKSLKGASVVKECYDDPGPCPWPRHRRLSTRCIECKKA